MLILRIIYCCGLRVENVIRPFVVGRKNWIFSDTAKGAKASAVVYSIMEMAKPNNRNVYMYMVYIFQQNAGSDIKSDPLLINDFMPWSHKLPDYCQNTNHRIG